MIVCFSISFHFNILEVGTDYLKTHEKSRYILGEC